MRKMGMVLLVVACLVSTVPVVAGVDGSLDRGTEIEPNG